MFKFCGCLVDWFWGVCVLLLLILVLIVVLVFGGILLGKVVMLEIFNVELLLIFWFVSRVENNNIEFVL